MIIIKDPTKVRITKIYPFVTEILDYLNAITGMIGKNIELESMSEDEKTWNISLANLDVKDIAFIKRFAKNTIPSYYKFEQESAVSLKITYTK